MRTCTLFFAMACLPAAASPTGFAERGRYAGGAAIIEPAYGGEYVHADQWHDRRVRTGALLLQVPVRQTYVFFSVEEEEALLNFRDQQRAAADATRAASPVKPRSRPTMAIAWPKVVLRGDEICVPQLSSSEANDWRDHLVCHAEGIRP